MRKIAGGGANSDPNSEAALCREIAQKLEPVALKDGDGRR